MLETLTPVGAYWQAFLTVGLIAGSAWGSLLYGRSLGQRIGRWLTRG